MFSAILILLSLPFADLSRSRGMQFRPLSKVMFYFFICNFLILMQLGAKHVESPFIEFGQISTVLYFAYFLIIIPFLSLFENSLIELPKNEKKTEVNKPINIYPVLQNKLTHAFPALGLILAMFNLNSIDYSDTPRP
jgi:ubiquinol-cytochrome c reductase cytochrome b subunit